MPTHSRRAFIAALPVLLSACATPEGGDAIFRPWVGQSGKDVMWVPTLDALVLPMLEAAAVKPDDLVYDLGSGDGKIPIIAAQRFGARAVGIEYDEKLSLLAQRNAERAGVTDRVRMIHGDIFKEDFSSATVLTLYLGQALNLKLQPTILAMKPGTRVVSNAFDMGTWEPDREIRLPEQNPVFLWVVPARVEGDWALTGLPGAPNATLRLAQTFQNVQGTLLDGTRPIGRVRGRLDGSRLAIEATVGDAPVRRLQTTVNGDVMAGRSDDEAATALAARRIR
jgi:SAM-dependent methyltransferase